MPKSIIVRSRSEACVDSGKGFVSSTGPHTNTAGGDMRFAKLGTGSSKVIRITKLIFSSDSTARWRVTQAPTTTADGTAQTIKNRRMGKGQTNEAVLYYGPTVTAEGDLIYDFWVNPATPVILDLSCSPWVLDPGNSILFTYSSGATNNGSMGIEWDEEPS
jgi:hypothetical protein